MDNPQNRQKRTNEELLEDIKDVAVLLKRTTVSQSEYKKYRKPDSGGHSTIVSRFGSWNNALSLANLKKSSDFSVTDEELFQEIARIWERLGKQPSAAYIDSNASKYSKTQYVNRFGGWQATLDAFIEYINTDDNSTENFELKTFHRNIPDEDLLKDMKRVADFLGKTYVNREDYSKHGQFTDSTIRNRFNGWVNACLKAKLSLVPHGSTQRKKSNEELLADLNRVANILMKDTVSQNEYLEHGFFFVDIFRRRFGSWNDALISAGLKKSSSKSVINKNFVDSISSPKNISKQSDKLMDSKVVDEHKLKSSKEKITTENDLNKRRKTNRQPNLRLRFLVLSRDNFKCCACGASPAKDPSVELHIDHIKPWIKGGETIIENLQTLCKNCNLGKSDII